MCRKNYPIITMILIMASLAACGSPTPTPTPSTVSVACSTADLISEINNANSTPGTTDTLELDPGCIYELDAVDNVTDGSNGLPSIISPIIINGNDATVRRGLSAQKMALRLFHISPNGSLTLNDITLLDGLGMNPPDIALPMVNNGGGAFNAGQLTINNSLLDANRAARKGGGIYNAPTGRLIVNATTLQNNETNLTGADEHGAGIYNAGVATISNSTIAGNIARGTGGGIVTDGPLIISNSIITNNSAGNGGGIYHVANTATLFVNTTEFIDNQAVGGMGGAIYNGDPSLTTLTDAVIRESSFSGNQAEKGGAIANVQYGDMALRNTILNNNTAAIGGAIYNEEDGGMDIYDTTIDDNGADLTGSAGEHGGGIANSGNMTISTSTISNNVATETGGGIANGGNLTIENSTISGNRTIMLSGGAIISGGGYLTIRYSTIMNNFSESSFPGPAVFTATDALTIENSIIANNPTGDCSYPASSTITGSNIGSDGSCTGFTITADPLLGPLSNNGGPTETHAFLPGSPALDGATGACLSTDQRGNPRPEGPACDIGAYESPLITEVPCSTAFLITEINNANSTPATTDILNLDPGCIYELAAVDNVTDGNNGTPTITSTIIINGNGATIQRSLASGTPEFRIFHLSAGSYLELRDLTLTNGVADGANNGGAVYAGSGLRIYDSFILNNRAENGGAVFHFSTGTLAVANTVFTNNQADDWGGAIYNGDPSSTIADAVIRNSIFEGNRASVGGAVGNNVSGDTWIRDSTFTGNYADLDGGAIANGDHMAVENSTLVGNIAQRRGGGINNGGILLIKNSTLSGNEAPFNNGGAITSIGGSLTINYSTIAFNITADGYDGAVHEERGALTINNSIIANNIGGDCNIPSSGASLGGVNIDSDGSCPGFTLTDDPLLGALADNGGFTQTHALLSGSPALNAATGDCPSTDQRGQSRPSGAACDVGAYESFESTGLTGVIIVDLLCWRGPGSRYEVVSSLKQGEQVELVGTGFKAGWLVVDNPIFPGVSCWVEEDKLDIDPDLDLSTLKVFTAPILPTKTPRPIKEGPGQPGQPTRTPCPPIKACP